MIGEQAVERTNIFRATEKLRHLARQIVRDAIASLQWCEVRVQTSSTNLEDVRRQCMINVVLTEILERYTSDRASVDAVSE